MGRFAWIFVVILLGLGASARSNTTMDIQFGWGSQFRPGTWTPIYLTLSDPSPRNLMLEIRTPTDSGIAMRIHQSVAVGPEPTTFLLLAPLTYDLSDVVVTAHDAVTGRKRAEIVLPTLENFSAYNERVQAQQPFIGVSGRERAMQTLHAQPYEDQNLAIGYLPPTLLPAMAEGYTALDVLALNSPNLDPSGAGAGSLRFEQQQAIIDWVKAGGNLILWFGEAPIPPAGPIMDALPCRIGDVDVLDADPQTLQAFGLPARFSQLKHRALTAVNDAETFNVLGDSRAVACHRRLGFGNVVVLSIDAGSLQFAERNDAMKFWQPVFSRVIERLDPPSTTQPYGYVDTQEAQAGLAVNAAMDLIGDVPGVGSFGFSYVVIVMIGLMFVVGPVDWFVLKKLGRQPWTWFTTAGWIALITGGAIYIGHVFKSGDLHFGSVRVIDQAGGETVATTELVGIYSPRTREYHLETDPKFWFRPPQSGQYYSGSLRGEIGFRQDYRGNHPEPMYINVWNLQFLQGESIVSGPPAVESNLHRTTDGQIAGSILNRTTASLTNIAIQTEAGICLIEGVVLPNEIVQVMAQPKPVTNIEYSHYAYYGYTESLDFKGLNYLILSALSARCDWIMREMIQRKDPIACIFAETVDPAPPATLSEAGAIQKHHQIIRAIVPLGNPGVIQ